MLSRPYAYPRPNSVAQCPFSFEQLKFLMNAMSHKYCPVCERGDANYDQTSDLLELEHCNQPFTRKQQFLLRKGVCGYFCKMCRRGAAAPINSFRNNGPPSSDRQFYNGPFNRKNEDGNDVRERKTSRKRSVARKSDKMKNEQVKNDKRRRCAESENSSRSRSPNSASRSGRSRSSSYHPSD